MSRSSSRGLLALTFILIAGGLLVLNLGGYLQAAEGLALRPLGALQGWLSQRVSAIQTLLTSPADLATLRAENLRLEAEVALLERELIALREQAAEAEVLAGQIITVRKRDYELFQQAVVQPSADLENLLVVLVITNFQPLAPPSAP